MDFLRVLPALIHMERFILRFFYYAGTCNVRAATQNLKEAAIYAKSQAL